MKIRELLSDESKWAIEAYARDSESKPVYPEDPKATCWCLLGAIKKCYPPKEREGIWTKVQEALPKGCDIQTFNDYSATFESIKKLVNDLDI